MFLDCFVFIDYIGVLIVGKFFVFYGDGNFIGWVGVDDDCVLCFVFIVGD